MAGDGVCSVGRLSRSAALVGLWRRRPGGARARPAAAERPQRARSDERPQWSLRRPRRRSAAPAGAQRRRHRCKCRCCYTLAYRVCRCSPAAACFCYRLVASNPLCHQTYTLCRTVLGVLSALAFAQPWARLFGRPIEPHPSRRRRAFPALNGVVWGHRAAPGQQESQNAHRPRAGTHTNLRTATRRRRDDSREAHTTTYKTS